MNSDSHRDSSQGVRVLSKRDWCSRGLKDHDQGGLVVEPNTRFNIIYIMRNTIHAH